MQVFIAGTNAGEYALRVFALKHTSPIPPPIQPGSVAGKAETPADITEMDGTSIIFIF